MIFETVDLYVDELLVITHQQMIPNYTKADKESMHAYRLQWHSTYTRVKLRRIKLFKTPDERSELGAERCEGRLLTTPMKNLSLDVVNLRCMSMGIPAFFRNLLWQTFISAIRI